MGRDKMMIINGIIVSGNMFADFSPVGNILYKLFCSFGGIRGDWPAPVGLYGTEGNMNIVAWLCNRRCRLAVIVGIGANHLIGKFAGNLIHKIDYWSRLTLILLFNFKTIITLTGVSIVTLSY